MSVPSPSIGQVFGHYRLLEQIGAGGMGVVFRARDEQLQRDVAVKVLPAGFLSDESRRDRFHKEALALGKLNHPNVAMAFDFGEESGVDYLVTEYITGPSLDEKIGKRPLPPKEVLELGIQMMNGLEAAHREGIIHRDLKPNNIRLDRDGKLKILDFGLAEFDSPIDHSAKTESLESSVSGGGTLPYMSPEQLKEEPVDARADIWAAGAVLYEMATGKRAFPDRQPSLVIDAILHHDPVRPMLLNPQITPALEALILKALDRDPERRYQSARELRVDLVRLLAGDEAITASSHHREVVARTTKRRLLATALLLLVIVLVGVGLKGWWPRQVAEGQKILAVLPIEAVGQDAATNALGLGLTETLTAKLVQASDIDAVQVVSPRDLRDQNVKTAEDARREFGTDYVLESSLQRAGQTLRINCYLVDSRTHRQLSARTIETDAGDTFGLQDEVVNAALDMLPRRIDPAQRKALAARQDTQPAAYEAYIRGRGYLQEYEKPENIDNAITEFNRALTVDHNYALAYAGLGNAYWRGFRPPTNRGKDWLAKASQNCEKALAISPDLPQANTCLGNILYGTGKYDAAIKYYQHALDFDATDDEALLALADAYSAVGNASAAESTYKKAVSLRPNYWRVYNWLGIFYYKQNRYADSVEMLRKATELAPDNYRGYANLGGVYIIEGNYQQAVETLNRSVALRPTADAYNNLGYSYFLMHRYSEAAATLEQALKDNNTRWEIWGNLADALYWSPQQRAEASDKYRKAIAIISSQLDVNPSDVQMLAYAASYSAMIGDQKAALKYLQKAVDLAPSNGEVLFRAAIVYAHFQQLNEAMACLQKAEEAGYSRAVIKDTPDFQVLEGNPKFKSLLSGG